MEAKEVCIKSNFEYQAEASNHKYVLSLHSQPLIPSAVHVIFLHGKAQHD